MEIEELNNISKNKYLSEKANMILQTKNIYSRYKMTQGLLEAINIKLLVLKLKKELPDYNIITFMNEYKEIDDNLYNQIMAINDLYNRIDEDEVEEYHIEYLLSKVDYIYGYIKEKYGEIMN